MIKKYKNNSITWVDVSDPTVEELRKLMNEYDINPDIARELQLPTYKEKIVMYKDYLYMVLHFPALRHTHTDSADQEIDFIVGKDFIITTRYESIDALERFAKTFELNNILKKGLMEDNAGYVLYYIVKELYRAMSDEVDSINDTLKQVEKNIFKGKEKEMVSEISTVSRDLISFNHIILTHRDVLVSLKESGNKLFGKDFSEYFFKIINEYHRIEKVLINNIDFLRELRNTNDSLLSSKQNETMKILTVFAFIAIPFSIITGFFQMSLNYIPFADRHYTWFFIIGIEVVVALSLFIFAKWRKWI
ncbi:MAG: CorA family divalent cation transporter [Candidatus Paceibacterota bacterium]|jgi:magnesium transporter